MFARRLTASSSGSGSGLLVPGSRPNSAYGPSRTGSLGGSVKSSIAEKYSLGPSPQSWGLPLHVRELDDDLHAPDARESRGSIFTFRGVINLGCLFLLAMACVTLFAGYPIISHFTEKSPSQRGFNLGGINASGQIPDLPGNFELIDRDTPQEVYSKPSYHDPKQEMVLVFSDEFNTDGRTFYPGDDPFWEAVDLHYWGTEDLEWYDPMQATTEGGSLRLKIDKIPDPSDNHNMEYRSGMIQSWNKFCFTGGILEASVVLPGSSTISGLWPAVWSMGNLGRAGYGGSLEGMWPYSYDTCDVGTLANQTYPGTQTPLAAWQNGDPTYDGQLSVLPGQKLSACTCPGESHPGPVRKDGTYVGRASPEIDVIEAIVEDGVGMASLSAQWAPFNARYTWQNDSDHLFIHDSSTVYNPYVGGGVQQTSSGLARTNQDCYELNKGCFAVYAFEYKPGFDSGYITWVNDGKLAWTLIGSGMESDAEAEIGRRPISQEPMYIIANLGLSLKFGFVDIERLIFPAVMSIDYIRVYQPAGQINIGCDPKAFPTAKYIETYERAYTNPNLTSWEKEVKEPWPKNRLLDQC